MRTLILLAALVASAFAANLVSCTRNGSPTTGDRFPWWYGGNDENATKHYANPNACTTWETPYCILMNRQSTAHDADEATWQFGCAECRSTCDCPIGKYCQVSYSEQDDFGKCVSYTNKIGKPCDGNLDSSSSTPSSPNVDPFYGDAMLCGIYIQYKNREVNSTVRVAPWTGVCVNGKCRECNSYMMYTPWHTSSLWYTASAQNLNANQRLECLWSGATHSIGTNAPYKRRPRRCSNFGWEHTNGIAVAAPAALLLIASAVFAL